MPFRTPRHALPALVPALIFALGFAALPHSALAWSYHTHRKICSDALNRMPAAFFQRFGQYKDQFLQGSTDPDTLLKDFMCHVYHVGGMTRDCENRVRGLFDQGADQLRRHDDRQAAYTLGLLSHYLADVNQPLHTAGSHTDPYESDYHAAFEKDVQSQMSKIPVGEIRFRPVTDPLQRLEAMARAARPHYEAIGKAYRTGNRYFDLQDMVQRQYTAAVQNVVDYWLGMLDAAGQSAGTTPGLAATLQTAEPAEAPAAAATGLSPTGRHQPLDLNTATLEQLKDLPGIGEKRARAILEARPFRSIYDLAKVQSFGKKLFDVKLIERISHLITVGP